MARKRAEDPDFKQKQLEAGKKSRQRPEALEKERIRNKNRDRSEYYKERNRKKKEELEKLHKDLEQMKEKLEERQGV